MQGVLPRTVAEFAASGRQVWVGCEECNRRKLVGNDVLEAMYGPEFDLFAGRAALEAELRCDICGEKHRAIIFPDGQVTTRNRMRAQADDPPTNSTLASGVRNNRRMKDGTGR